jgi:hypothetical protein
MEVEWREEDAGGGCWGEKDEDEVEERGGVFVSLTDCLLDPT